MLDTVVARYLTASDIDEMVKVENETWIPLIRAPKERMLYRLENGHRYFGYVINGELAGMVGLSYQHIKSPEDFPSDFSTFSSGKSELDRESVAYIYNVGVAKKFQKQGVGKKMVQETFQKIREDGVKEIYLDGRCPSYNGSKDFPEIEFVDQQLEFKRRIDECVRENKVPTPEDVMFDPTLRFYSKLGFVPIKLSANFLTADKAAGGFRVIMYQRLE